MQKIRLEIVGLTNGQQQGSYTLILGEENGERKLPIIIGSFEAQAIAIEIEKIVPFRPMTHDLFVSFTRLFHTEVKEVIIYNLVEGVFYAKLICVQEGITKELDARTSDAIALAVRFKCPVYTYDDILRTAGIVIQDEEEEGVAAPDRPKSEDAPKKGRSFQDTISSMPTEELEKMLEDAIRVEEYDRAAIIRDEINRRKNS